MVSRTGFISMLVLCGLLILSGKVIAQTLPESINWNYGPGQVDVGKNLAQLKLSEDVVFADEHDTKTIMEMAGNPLSGREIGIVMPRDYSPGWFVVFEYDGLGYIKDNEADTLNADALLKNIIRGTEAANKIRKSKGQPPVYVIGWDEKPHYDPISHNLVWSILGESEGEKIINYNTRLLGRKGYISATLVVKPDTFVLAKPQLASILGNMSYKKGMMYADFIPGKDKVAGIGLAALIAGGGGAAVVKAAKVGFFVKFWKVILTVLLVGKKFVIIAFIGLIALLSKLFRRRSTFDQHNLQ